MTAIDFDTAIEICTLFESLYNKGKGFISADEKRILITFDSFIKFFREFSIESEWGNSWRLYTDYNGFKVVCLASYSDMLSYDRTKEYLKEKLIYA